MVARTAPESGRCTWSFAVTKDTEFINCRICPEWHGNSTRGVPYRTGFSPVRTWTVVFRPCFVLARAMAWLVTSVEVSSKPWHARVTCGKKRCSMGLYFEQYGG